MFVHILATAILFILLTPGILVTLPPKSKKVVVAFTHALIFTILTSLYCHFIYKKSISWFYVISSFILFYLLTPGILVTIPAKGNKYEVSIVHAIVFILIECILMYFFGRKAAKVTVL